MVEWTASFMVDGDPTVLMEEFSNLMNEYQHEASLFDSMGDLVLTNGRGI